MTGCDQFFSYIFRVHDVLEVLQPYLSVLPHAAAKHVLQPLQVLNGQLRPRAENVKKVTFLSIGRICFSSIYGKKDSYVTEVRLSFCIRSKFYIPFSVISARMYTVRFARNVSAFFESTTCVGKQAKFAFYST